MKNNSLIYFVLGFMAFIIFLAGVGKASDYQAEQPTEWVEPAEQDYGTVGMAKNYPDWTLSIPEINFEQQMTQVIKQGRTLPVPDSNPGYYSETTGNLFIIGHSNSVFNRLSELPSKIYIYQNNSPHEYLLINSETTLVENIDMQSLLNYQGVVIMTCAGDKIGDAYSHRLILYYNS